MRRDVGVLVQSCACARRCDTPGVAQEMLDWFLDQGYPALGEPAGRDVSRGESRPRTNEVSPSGTAPSIVGGVMLAIPMRRVSFHVGSGKVVQASSDVHGESSGGMLASAGRVGVSFAAFGSDAPAARGGTMSILESAEAKSACAMVSCTLVRQLANGAEGGLAGLFARLGLPDDRRATMASMGARSAAQAARNAWKSVIVNGSDAGEAATCYLGGAGVLGTLESLGGCGTGWRDDRRTGRRTLFYCGTPCHQVPSAESSETGPLWAASLGPTGLELLCVAGCPASFGIELAVLKECDVATGRRQCLIFGAWWLALWEEDGLFQITDFPVTRLDGAA